MARRKKRRLKLAPGTHPVLELLEEIRLANGIGTEEMGPKAGYSKGVYREFMVRGKSPGFYTVADIYDRLGYKLVVLKKDTGRPPVIHWER